MESYFPSVLGNSQSLSFQMMPLHLLLQLWWVCPLCAPSLLPQRQPDSLLSPHRTPSPVGVFQLLCCMVLEYSWPFLPSYACLFLCPRHQVPIPGVLGLSSGALRHGGDGCRVLLTPVHSASGLARPRPPRHPPLCPAGSKARFPEAFGSRNMSPSEELGQHLGSCGSLPPWPAGLHGSGPWHVSEPQAQSVSSGSLLGQRGNMRGR